MDLNKTTCSVHSMVQSASTMWLQEPNGTVLFQRESESHNVSSGEFTATQQQTGHLVFGKHTPFDASSELCWIIEDILYHFNFLWCIQHHSTGQIETFSLKTPWTTSGSQCGTLLWVLSTLLDHAAYIISIHSESFKHAIGTVLNLGMKKADFSDSLWMKNARNFCFPFIFTSSYCTHIWHCS